MRWLTGQCSWTTTLGHVEPELYNIFYSKRLFRQFHGLRCHQTWTLQYFWPVRLPSRMYKSNLQSKEKQPQTVTPPAPKAVVPKMWLSWNEVFRWRQTLARPSPISTIMRWLTGQCSWATMLGHIEPELYNIFLQQEPCANSPPQVIMWPVKSSMAMT
jgi:hypothetical protein